MKILYRFAALALLVLVLASLAGTAFAANTLSQLKGKSGNCAYDDTVYSLKVTVSYSQNGSDLEAALALYPAGGAVKASQALFVNKYAYPPSDTPRTGDSSLLPLYGALGLLSLAALVLSLAPLLKRSRRDARA